MNRYTLVLLIGVIALVMIAGCSSATPTQEVLPPTAIPATGTATQSPTVPASTITATPEPTAGKVVLTIIGPEGEKAFTMVDLMQLPVTEGQAGIKSSTGRITIPSLFKGVSMLDLVALVGGLGEDMGVNVVAEDGYAMTFSLDQLTQGNFIAYDPATGEEKKIEDKLQVILAYERDGQPLTPESDGTLRLVIISPKNNQVTDGHWSVKWVNKIEVKPLGQEWNLQLTGVITDTVDRNSFQSCSAVNCHQSSWTDDKAQKWVGVPLWLLAGRMDDSIKHDGPAFNRSLADLGYLIQIIATDGYSTTLESALVAHNNNIMVAFQVNENPLPDKYFPLRLVGTELQQNQTVGQIVEIKMIVDPLIATRAAQSQPRPTQEVIQTPQPSTVQGDLVIIGLVNQELGFNEADLRKLDVVEITAEHPKKGKETYQGVRLNALLEMVKLKPEARKLVFTAADGYTAEVELAKLLACTDCLLAFTETPGKFKLVMPELESALWVKDIIKIEVK
jgi:DMSO/TMAO reductase YedYZ molybdopterin-dependent catalytic subunit